MLQRSLLHGLIACVFVFTSLTASSAFADVDRETLVKSINITGIVGFVAPISKQPKIVVCVLGDNPILNTANAIQKKYPSISLVKETRINNISSHCQAVFIGTDETGEYGNALDALKGKPVLTISDSPDFIERGGMVMLSSQGKITFIINKGVMERAELHPDPQLLELASKVIDD